MTRADRDKAAPPRTVPAGTSPGDTLAFGQNPSPELLYELDHAILEHLAWLKAWHRALLCGGDDACALSAQTSALGRFGTWFLQNRDKGLVNQPAIRALAGLDRRLREHGRALAARAAHNPPLPAADYDAFMDEAARFVAEARRLERAFVAAVADLDPLTGIPNRQAMDRDLQREHARALRTSRPCAIALADIDHFKAINDTFGHAGGDRVLAAVADGFAGGLRPYDAVYRYGGEEFLFCLPEASVHAAILVLQRILDALRGRSIPLGEGNSAHVTCSFGVASVAADCTLEESVARADRALYAAKAAGRARVCAWPIETSPPAR